MVRAATLLVVLLGGGRALGAPELPAGKWTGRDKGVETCVEALPGQRLRLTFLGPTDRHPIVIDGGYRVTATKMGDFHVEMTVDTIQTKTLSNCRENWIDETLPSTRQLDAEIKPGQKLKLTFHFGCAGGKDSLQLCLHGGKVACRNLANQAGAPCREGPAIDGSKINAPAR